MDKEKLKEAKKKFKAKEKAIKNAKIIKK